MPVNPTALTIRAKKLGALTRDARLVSGKSVEECARAIGIPAEKLDAYELGELSPSLPELEALAQYLDVPLEHFWSDRALSSRQQKPVRSELEQRLSLRQRIIGARIRKARLDAGLTLEELAEEVIRSPEQLEAYELGDAPIPLPDLEVLCSILERSLIEFQDRKRQTGAWAVRQRAVQNFMEMDPEMQAFITKPVNRPYLELAQRLSEMDVDKLRAIAEGLLAITL